MRDPCAGYDAARAARPLMVAAAGYIPLETANRGLAALSGVADNHLISVKKALASADVAI